MNSMIESRVVDFFDFVVHRQLIYYKKEVLREKYPWTTDPILNEYHFCNVFREADRGTRYIINYFKKYPDISKEKVLYTLVFYRHFNVSGLMDHLQEHYCQHPDKYPRLQELEQGLVPYLLDEQARWQFEQLLTDYKARRGTLYNVAYRVAPHVVNPDYPHRAKHVQFTFVLKKLSKQVHAILQRILGATEPSESSLPLQSIPSVGAFLAYEIWTDLTYFSWFKWSDDDYVSIGPGAAGGLQVIFGGNSADHQGQKGVDACKQLRDLQKQYLPRLSKKYGIQWEEISLPESSTRPWLSLRNIEHALCEFRKYWQRKRGKGRKRYYRPSREKTEGGWGNRVKVGGHR